MNSLIQVKAPASTVPGVSDTTTLVSFANNGSGAGGVTIPDVFDLIKVSSELLSFTSSIVVAAARVGSDVANNKAAKIKRNGLICLIIFP